MKIGDKLICIDNNNDSLYLTIGEEYIVSSLAGGGYVVVKNDRGNFSAYALIRFKGTRLDKLNRVL